MLSKELLSVGEGKLEGAQRSLAIVIYGSLQEAQIDGGMAEMLSCRDSLL